MTVKEIFNLRKQGHIEEAYEAIRPMYAEHKGKYTTLCMYIVAKAIFNKRILENRISDAAKIYEALKHVVPNIDDPDGHAAAFMQFAQQRLAVPAVTGSPTAAAPAGSPSVPAFSGSPASSGSLHFSGESAPAEGLNTGQQAVLDCIKAHEGINVPRISEGTNIPSKSIERHVSALIARNLIEHRGSKKTGGYYAK